MEGLILSLIVVVDESKSDSNGEPTDGCLNHVRRCIRLPVDPSVNDQIKLQKVVYHRLPSHLIKKYTYGLLLKF